MLLMVICTLDHLDVAMISRQTTLIDLESPVYVLRTSARSHPATGVSALSLLIQHGMGRERWREAEAGRLENYIFAGLEERSIQAGDTQVTTLLASSFK